MHRRITLLCYKKNQHNLQTNLSLHMVTTLFKLSFCLPLALSVMTFEIAVTIPMTSDLKVKKYISS